MIVSGSRAHAPEPLMRSIDSFFDLSPLLKYAPKSTAATDQRRPRRALLAITRLAIGFKYQVEMTGICALDRVIRDPRVSSLIKGDVPRTTNQAAVLLISCLWGYLD